MKRHLLIRTILSLFILFVFILSGQSAYAAFDSGSTGSDGAFAPTANIALQVPASCILKFTTVNILAGVTVTFLQNSMNTPVTLLASGDIVIAGTISVNGANGNYLFPGTGGPGGFYGGVGGTVFQTGKRGDGPSGAAGKSVLGRW